MVTDVRESVVGSLVTRWSLAGHSLVTPWSLAGHLLVTRWSLAGRLMAVRRLAHSFLVAR